MKRTSAERSNEELTGVSDLAAIASYLESSSLPRKLKRVLGKRIFECKGIPEPVTCWDLETDNGRYWAFAGGLPLSVYPHKYALGCEDDAFNLHLGRCFRIWADKRPPWANKSPWFRRLI